MESDTERLLANLDGVAITIQRLPPGHREGDKVYLSFTDASGATVSEVFLSEHEWGCILKGAASRVLTPA